MTGQQVTVRVAGGAVQDGGRAVVDRVVTSDWTGGVQRSGQRRDVIPPWMRDRQTAAAAARWGAAHAAHTSAFHALRVPLYGARLVARSPVGAWRLLAAMVRWVLDTAGRDVRTAMSGLTRDQQSAETFLRLTAQRRETVRDRAAVVAGGAVVALLAGVGLVATMSTPAMAGIVAAVVAVLGVVGRRADRPLTSRAVDSEAVPRLTSGLILTALGSLGLGEMNKAIGRDSDTAVRFPAPIVRDGPGFRAEIDLPPGVTAGDVIERRDRLASGLRRPLGCVWPEVDSDAHAGRLVLWVGDRSLSASKPVAWPLAKSGRVNLFEPFAIGTDQRGRSVEVTLMYASGVIGAIPRMGKTVLLRLLLLAAALDQRCEIHAYNLKGGSDLDPLEAVAYRYRTGDDTEDIDYLVRDLRAVSEDMRARYRTIRDLPRAVCPESKVSDELASRRDLSLHPVLVALDECQIGFEHPEHGAEITSLVTDLVKRGPAVGVMLWAATQRPDAKSLPTGISANAVLRLCLKVQGQLENDMVLGTSAYKNGTRATMFGRKDRGIALLSGEGDDPVIVRVSYIDTQAADTIAARARTARMGAGLLTGHAAGQDPDSDTDTASVLDHLAATWPADEDRAWCDDLAARLAATYPATYNGWTGEQVTAAVKPHGLRASQIKRTTGGQQINKRGLARVDLATALADRDDTPEPF
jgi:DNA segregation ATPase FtsK/SpoIIIE, S-DNA-T family